jgi:hypothetical protein
MLNARETLDKYGLGTSAGKCEVRTGGQLVLSCDMAGLFGSGRTRVNIGIWNIQGAGGSALFYKPEGRLFESR